jgi:hypothetical protein
MKYAQHVFGQIVGGLMGMLNAPPKAQFKLERGC